MRVQVKLFAWLRRKSPDGPHRGRIALELPAGAAVADALGAVGLSPEEMAGGLVLLRNGHHSSENDRLEEGDILSVFPPLAGGSSLEV